MATLLSNAEGMQQLDKKPSYEEIVRMRAHEIVDPNTPYRRRALEMQIEFIGRQVVSPTVTGVPEQLGLHTKQLKMFKDIAAHVAFLDNGGVEFPLPHDSPAVQQPQADIEYLR